MLKFLFVFLILFSLPSMANISAKREKNQSYKELISKSLSLNESGSALSLAGPLEDLDLLTVIEWESVEIMQERFEQLRDERFIETGTEDLFMRRISWLYPDDGCFARAAKFINRAEEIGFVKPERIFIFGDLNVKTNNHPDGEVNWWYHTAPIVRIEEEVFVLDAAINPKGPLPVEEWILRQVKNIEDAEISFCSSHSHIPYSVCKDADESTDDGADSQQLNYLRYEKSRQEQLGRDPDVVLGDRPPWLELAGGIL